MKTAQNKSYWYRIKSINPDGYTIVTADGEERNLVEYQSPLKSLLQTISRRYNALLDMLANNVIRYIERDKAA